MGKRELGGIFSICRGGKLCLLEHGSIREQRPHSAPVFIGFPTKPQEGDLSIHKSTDFSSTRRMVISGASCPEMHQSFNSYRLSGA
ncbi:hypothetical protein PGIGA_G00026810 [Pangasianodon gigas]|uniref:Uncharacterized protein n=1 Tax=Pangasianodon gigas TaxID=30993 RepID=A0ACC5WXI6_PANGG|nr:hypothetical protein [Pangasianodon gigas]